MAGGVLGGARRAQRPPLRSAWLSALALLTGAALWIWAAHALWPSTVPESVRLPHLEPSRFFGDSFLQRSDTYAHFLEIEGLLAIVVLLVVLAVYARYGHRLMRESAAGRIGTGMMLGMLGLAVAWLVSLPFGIVALWWQRRYDVSHQGYLEWVVNSFFGLGGKFVFVSVALLVAMGLAGVLRNWWWVAAAPVFVGLALLFTFIGPYLIRSTATLVEPHLMGYARVLERAHG